MPIVYSWEFARAYYSASQAPAAGIALFCSDLSDGPKTGGENNNGVYVTLFGYGFGATRGAGTVTLGGGAVASYVSWSDGKIVVQLGSAVATGNFTVTNNSGQSATGCIQKPAGETNDFTVRSGNIYFVSTSGSGTVGSIAAPISPTQMASQMAAGHTYYLRAGTYNGIYNASAGSPFETFEIDSTHSGTAQNFIAIVGYPGEQPRFNGQSGRETCIHLNWGGDLTTPAHHLTFSNLYINGGIEGGATLSLSRSGGRDIRLVGCKITAEVWGTSTVSTGAVDAPGDNWHILANEFTLIGGVVGNNQAHALYVQIGASHIRIRWNYFHDNITGAQCQIHTDEQAHDGGGVGPFFFDDVIVDSNIFTSTSDQARGVTCSDMTLASNVLISNNLFYACGSGAGAIIMIQGTHKVYNNTLYNCSGSNAINVSFFGTDRGDFEVKNNIIYGNLSTGYVGRDGGTSPLVIDNNCYFGNGSGPGADTHAINANPLFTNAGTLDFTLQAGSPARNAGLNLSSLVPLDKVGVPRPQGAAMDLGAYEAS